MKRANNQDPTRLLSIEQRQQDWMGTRAKHVDVVITEECQLRCGYCYCLHKNKRHTMNRETAEKAVDFLLSHQDLFPERAVVFNFMGGEPLLAIDIIDHFCDYFKRQSFLQDHPWFEMYRFIMTTNGLLYSHPATQHFIDKNREHLEITITLDGTERKHDMQRVFPDGKGSYKEVVKQIPLWLEQFPNANTKVTFAHEDLPYVCESILHIWDLGIKSINANVVFENVWEEGDDLLFEEQLKELADTIIEKELYLEYQCSLFDRYIGYPDNNLGNWCGSGKMICVDAQGLLYPCVRFMDFTLENRPAIIIGDIYSGIDSNKLRPFLALTRQAQSTEECLNCEVASGCAWCQAVNYDHADSETIYQRATFLCKCHKARVRANHYFWKKMDEIKQHRKDIISVND